jgi:hypothetical protein
MPAPAILRMGHHMLPQNKAEASIERVGSSVDEAAVMLNSH